jgi:hypothetical protein
MEIVYPVFRIGSEKPIIENGVALFIRHTINNSGEEKLDCKLLDDTNIPKPTLALRRLQLLKEGIAIKKLGRAVFFLGDLVKMANSTTWLIDSVGTIFQYKKTTNTKLQFKKITYVHKISTGGAILEIEGIPSRFKTLFAPTNAEKFAGILVRGRSYILYGLYTEKYDDTRRMI